MLTKLENAYLFILRVVVLAAATLSLIGVILGLVGSVAYVAGWLTLRSVTPEVPGGSLGDYVVERRSQGVAVDATSPP
jgi:hypothetical protein